MCLTVFVNGLVKQFAICMVKQFAIFMVKQFAICLGVFANLLLNVLDGGSIQISI